MNFNFQELHRLQKYFWKRGFLAWKLHEGQLAIYEKIRSFEPHQKEALVFCARRFGKSTLGVVLALEDCLRKEGQVRIIGPTIKQTISIVEPILRKMTLDAPEGLIKRIKSEYRWYVGSSELIIGGFDGQNITRHLGQESISIYLEESGAARSEDFTYAIVEVLTPHLLHTQGMKIHLTTPPKELNHPLITDVLPKVKELNTYFFATIYDNPLLSDEQITAAIEESGGFETAAFKRNYLCELVKDTETLVVPQFVPSKHTFSEQLTQPYEWVWVVGDWGGVRDKTSILFCTFYHQILFVHDELIFDNHTSSQEIFIAINQIKKLRHYHFTEPWVIDAPPAMTIDWWEKFRITVRIPKKQVFEEGISVLRQAFFQDKIQINERCQFLIKSCLYGRLTKNQKDFERRDDLGHCDALAALLYAYRSLPKGEKEDGLSFLLPHQIRKDQQIKGDRLLEGIKKKRDMHLEQLRLGQSGMKSLSKLFSKV